MVRGCCLIDGTEQSATEALDKIESLLPAEWLTRYLRRAGSPPPGESVVAEAQQVQWPKLISTDAAAGVREPHFLTRLVDRLPRLADPQGRPRAGGAGAVEEGSTGRGGDTFQLAARSSRRWSRGPVATS
nr:hypothetical protein Ade03nite_77070 [Actinoplanes derwentensis]